MYRHAVALGAEYAARYGKIHKSTKALKLLPPALVSEAYNPEQPIWFAQCVPDAYKVKDNPVLAYRTYYISEKRGIAVWKNGAPGWWHTGLQGHKV